MNTWRKKNKTPHNTDGLINCLRQPGQLRNRPQKSMRVNSYQLIKFCGNGTNPAPKTKSIGLPADAQLSWFLHASLITLSGHDKSCPLIGTRPSGQFHHYTKRSSTYRAFAKTHANPDTDGNSLNRRAVRHNYRFRAQKKQINQPFRVIIEIVDA